LKDQQLDVRRDTVVPCPTRLPRQALLDAERDLSAALAAARASVAHCEAALTRLAAELGQDMPSFLPAGAATRADHLSARETQILQFMVRGRSNREVAEALYLSPRTVERHIANIYCKLRVHNRAEAVRYALEIGRATERRTAPAQRH
jgi:DNA-binding NarL/FixJ family response regulator